MIVWNDIASVPRDGTFIWGETSPEWVALMRWNGREWRGAGGLLYHEPLRWMRSWPSEHLPKPTSLREAARISKEAADGK